MHFNPFQLFFFLFRLFFLVPKLSCFRPIWEHFGGLFALSAWPALCIFWPGRKSQCLIWISSPWSGISGLSPKETPLPFKCCTPALSRSPRKVKVSWPFLFNQNSLNLRHDTFSGKVQLCCELQALFLTPFFFFNWLGINWYLHDLFPLSLAHTPVYKSLPKNQMKRINRQPCPQCSG